MTNEKGTKSERRRPRASERRAASGGNPLRTVSASSRRAERAARRGDVPAETSKKAAELDHATLAELLHNPTKFVSEEELRREYAYVLNDLKSMAVLAVGLLVLLITLALVLPV